MQRKGFEPLKALGHRMSQATFSFKTMILEISECRGFWAEALLAIKAKRAP